MHSIASDCGMCTCITYPCQYDIYQYRKLKLPISISENQSDLPISVILNSDIGKWDDFSMINQNDFLILENQITDIGKYTDLPILLIILNYRYQ